MSHRTLTSWITTSLRDNADLVALRVRRRGDWVTTTYRELDEISARLATAVLELGLTPGDRVAIHAGNSPEWTMVDIACLRAGLVTVPIYTTSTPSQIAHVLRDSGARVVVCGTEELLARTQEALATDDDLDTHMPCVLLPGDRHADDTAGAEGASVRTLAQILDTVPGDAETLTRLREEFAAKEEEVDPDTPVTIIYTSGTTGAPKGVVLTQRAYSRELYVIDTLFGLPRGERNMSFLPLSHAYERGWTYCALASGMENCSVTDPKTVAAAMLDIRPATFVSVPRLYEKVYAGAHQLAGEGVKRRLFDWALRVGADVQRRRREGRPVPRTLAARHALADRLVLHNVRDVVGGEKYVMAAGGAPLRQEVEEFFLAAGLPIYQGYGLTETAPLVSCNAPGAVKSGTAGRPVPGTEVRISDETGEILVRGDNVTPGYYNRPEETAAVIDEEGWFHTGDVGHLDADGYLLITDRIKDLIVTMQGKNIAPGPIESALTADPLVEAAVVIGDGRPYLTALIQPSFEELEHRAREKGWASDSTEELLARGEVEQYYDDLIARVGRDSARYERIQKFRLLSEPLTMDAGEITPTLKVRRGPVERRHADLITSMYQ
ncbi:AMP-dependent synthetase/ligase [Mobilicoccus pelagius]|uniref:Long-chain fatty-acid--CoA ligase n=1 Tax=Mobilicoccus pelagius NBRC 104925 TaxID=1089455 RepID=H5UPT7_9MICO|nr:long-chain fatty acid--CoA ligase [Mobilicoccus pelagius]GAB47742.1 long-chain fatty-acid--CoA ligase [Mobilicoccus pelagius NBRC 104925]